jgi:hypothetical protein
MTPELVSEFQEWIDRVSSECEEPGVAAFGFLLYEHEDSFAIQLVGAGRYVPSDPFSRDKVLFSSGEDLFELPRADVGAEWQEGLAAAMNLVRRYLNRRPTDGPLHRTTVAIGFVDGDIEVIQDAAPAN